MNFLSKYALGLKKLNFISKRCYHFPEKRTGAVQRFPGLTAKRIIRCVGEKLRQVDPARWETVPITFKTHFRDEEGFIDIYTCIHVHEALEREFGIEIKDKQILVSDVETAFSVVMQTHESL